MSSGVTDSDRKTIRLCCWNCHERALARNSARVREASTAPRDTDYFALFEMPRKLVDRNGSLGAKVPAAELEAAPG